MSTVDYHRACEAATKTPTPNLIVTVLIVTFESKTHEWICPSMFRSMILKLILNGDFNRIILLWSRSTANRMA